MKEIECQIKRNDNDRVTNYEIAIPFSSLAPLKPQTGKIFGFSFVVLDDDIDAGQEYRMELSGGICGGKAPSKFKKFIFTEK